MATQTQQDSWISSQLSQLNSALDVVSRVALEGSISRQRYKGATREEQYYKLCQIVLKYCNKIAEERKRL